MEKREITERMREAASRYLTSTRVGGRFEKIALADAPEQEFNLVATPDGEWQVAEKGLCPFPVSFVRKNERKGNTITLKAYIARPIQYKPPKGASEASKKIAKAHNALADEGMEFPIYLA